MADTKPGWARLADLAFIPETYPDSPEEAVSRKLARQEGKIEGLREYITWLEEKNAQLQEQVSALLRLTGGRVN